VFFIQELIDALRKGELHLDCLEMVLTQEGAESPEVLQGPGYIAQKPDGTLSFTLYSSQRDTSIEFSDPYQHLIPGQLLPPTEYYSLRATDNHRRVWTAQRIRVDVHTVQLEDGRWANTASGLLRDIEYIDRHAGQGTGQELQILFFEKLDLPYNLVSHAETHVAGELVSRGFSRNVARFRAGGFACDVTNDDDVTTFKVTTDGGLPPRMEVRVIEAFQFVFARTFWPRVIRIFDAGSEIIRFTSALQSSGKPRMARPIQQGHLEELAWTWVLFDKYLTFILPFPHDGWHPCSRHLYAVSKASVSGVHSEALALGVAVEGLCTELFGHLCEPQPSLLATVQALREYCRDWPGSESDADTTSVRARLTGLIGMLTQPRAQDRLRFLASAGWIDRDLIAAWQGLRNRTAHGSTPGFRVPQAFLDQCSQVTDLLYQLVFCAIGYEGMYILRTPGAWRPRTYPSPEFWASRSEAIRVNAYYRWLERGAGHGNDLDDWLAAERYLLETEWRQVANRPLG
jgi:hypothetical protein